MKFYAIATVSLAVIIGVLFVINSDDENSTSANGSETSIEQPTNVEPLPSGKKFNL